MKKSEELSNPKSCMSRAREDEMTFVLLARDAAAPETIRDWAERRVKMRKNRWGDNQIREALECAKEMERQREAGLPRQEEAGKNNQ